MMKVITLLAGLAGLLALAGCGQKGDLYQSETAPPPMPPVIEEEPAK